MGQAQLSGLGVPQGSPWPGARLLVRGTDTDLRAISKEAWSVWGGVQSKLDLGCDLQSDHPDALLRR